MNQQGRLFRAAAVEASLGTQFGEVFAAHWRGVRILTILAFVFTTGLFVLLGTVQYSPAYRVPCYTDAQHGLARLTSPVDGQVVRLIAVDGAHVRKGDLLAVLSTDKLMAGGESEHTAVAARLRAERDMIDREIDAAASETRANHEMISRRITGLRLERDTSQAEVQSAQQLLSSLRAQLEQFSSLVASGYVSKLQLAQKHDEVMQQESRAAATRAAVARIDRDIQTSLAEQDAISAHLKGIIENRRRDADELERLIIQSDSNAQQVIRASMDGIISTAFLVGGQSVEQGQALFSISPANEPLTIRLLVAARAAAAVKPGMNFHFTLRAYPREKFGHFDARLVSISATPSLPSDVTQVLSIDEAAFVATASLPLEIRASDGRLLRLKPGMVGEALIPIERRTLLEWLLDPFLRGLNK
jgi:membrane fusion protein